MSDNIYICMILYIYIYCDLQWIGLYIYIYVYIAFTVHNRILVYMTMYYVINHDSTVIVLLPYYLPKITNWYINIEHINIDKSHIYIYTITYHHIYIHNHISLSSQRNKENGNHILSTPWQNTSYITCIYKSTYLQGGATSYKLVYHGYKPS